MTYEGLEQGSYGGAEDVRTPERGRSAARSRDDASRAAIDAPAHPLPAVRHGKVDYDLYLESQTSRFRIFSAEEERRRRRSVALVVGGAVAAVVLLWLIITHL